MENQSSPDTMFSLAEYIARKEAGAVEIMPQTEGVVSFIMKNFNPFDGQPEAAHIMPGIRLADLIERQVELEKQIGDMEENAKRLDTLIGDIQAALNGGVSEGIAGGPE